VDMPDDSLFPQCFHGMRQNVAADCLCEVFQQRRAVGLDPLLFKERLPLFFTFSGLPFETAPSLLFACFC
jgi:hypothetical protein